MHEMKITIELPAYASMGLRHAAKEANDSLESTAAELLREILISHGYIEPIDPTNDNEETEGEA